MSFSLGSRYLDLNLELFRCSSATEAMASTIDLTLFSSNLFLSKLSVETCQAKTKLPKFCCIKSKTYFKLALQGYWQVDFLKFGNGVGNSSEDGDDSLGFSELVGSMSSVAFDVIVTNVANHLLRRQRLQHQVVDTGEGLLAVVFHVGDCVKRRPEIIVEKDVAAVNQA